VAGAQPSGTNHACRAQVGACLLLILYLAHLFACLFFLAARVDRLGPGT
jgi:hypothetical protein